MTTNKTGYLLDLSAVKKLDYREILIPTDYHITDIPFQIFLLDILLDVNPIPVYKMINKYFNPIKLSEMEFRSVLKALEMFRFCSEEESACRWFALRKNCVLVTESKTNNEYFIRKGGKIISLEKFYDEINEHLPARIKIAM